MKRFTILALAALASFTATSAFAHDDSSPDGDRYSTTRCDTYYRDGHQVDASGDKPKKTNGDPNPNYDAGTAHSEDHESEFDEGEPTGTGVVYVHNHPGHYGVRGDAFYVEVIGGQGFNRDGNQGGFAQGEVDPGSGAPDVDFHGGTYAGTNGPLHSENACVSAADNKIGESGQQDVGASGTYCPLDAVTTSCTFNARERGLRVYSELSTGMKITVKVGNTTTNRFPPVTLTGPLVNASYSYAIVSGDKVTCELIAGSAPAPAGRASCGA